jgi:hypothetical protein
VVNVANNMISKQKPLSMYNDWSPPLMPPIVPLKLNPKEAYAVGTSSVSNNPEKALNIEGFWKSIDCKSVSGLMWGVKLTEPAPLFAFQIVFEETLWPEEVQVQVRLTRE